MRLIAGFLLALGLISAQNPKSGASYFGQSWVGLLVSASCPAPKHDLAKQESEGTVADRVTTPAVDTPGTRGSSDPAKAAPAAKGDVPQTGDVSIRSDRKIKDPDWKLAQRQAASLASSCQVNSETKQFALLLPDGTRLRFDDVANGKIAAQLESRGASGTPKILRVQVTGKLQGGAIAIDQLQM